MQKIALMVVISGTLIVGGLILLALGNQVILDEMVEQLFVLFFAFFSDAYS